VFMGNCIVTGDEITKDNDSEAHIIASAFGGRLSPLGILSRKGNNILDRKIDNPHIKAMQPYMTLVDGSPDRGSAPGPIQMTGANNKRYLVGSGEVRPLDHEYNVQSVDGQPVGTIKAISQKQAKELMGKVQKEFNLTDEQVKEHLAKAQIVEEDAGKLERGILAGPAVEFPAAFTMSAIFCAHHGLAVRSDFKRYIESIDEKTGIRPLPPDTFYFIHSVPWFKLEAEMGHCLILYGDPIRKQAIFFSQLFNLLGIAVTMPFDGNQPVLRTYGVDILAGKDVSVHVNEADLCGLIWEETHKLGDAELFAINEERGARVMKLASERDYNRACQAVWEKYKHSAFTNETVNAAFKDFCQLINRIVKPEFREVALRDLRAQFDKLGKIEE